MNIAYEVLFSLQKSSRYKGKWLSDETIVREINRSYDAISSIWVITKYNLNLATGPKGCGNFCGGVTERFDESNPTGISSYFCHHIHCVHQKKNEENVFLFYW